MGSTVNKILGFNLVNKASQSYTKKPTQKKEIKQQQKVCHLKLVFIFLDSVALGSIIVMQQAF